MPPSQAKIRRSPRVKSQLKGHTSKQVGNPTLPCEKKPQKPTPPQAKPCDLDKVQIKCSHCGNKRSEFTEGVFWVDQKEKKYYTNYPDLKKQDFWEVTANSADSSHDEITLKITRGPCHDPGEHPSIFITHPPELGGKVEAHKGKTELTFKAAYPKDWFKRNLAAAKQHSGLEAIQEFFFPEPVTYHIHILSCGQRPAGQRVFRALGSWRQRVVVYTDDSFTLGIKFPSAKKSESVRSGGRVGHREFSSKEKTQTSGFGHTVESQEEITYQTNGRTAVQQIEVVRERDYGVRQTQTLGETQNGTASLNRMVLLDKTDSALGVI